MDAQEILRSNGLKVTKPRAAILQILAEAGHGLDAGTIREEARKQGLFIDLSTVYRTLDLLVEHNLADKFDGGDNRHSFLLKKDHHKHCVICEVCHKSVKLDCPMSKIEELIARETGFFILEHHLELKGICRDCTRLKQEQK